MIIMSFNSDSIIIAHCLIITTKDDFLPGSDYRISFLDEMLDEWSIHHSTKRRNIDKTTPPVNLPVINIVSKLEQVVPSTLIISLVKNRVWIESTFKLRMAAHYRAYNFTKFFMNSLLVVILLSLRNFTLMALITVHLLSF